MVFTNSVLVWFAFTVATNHVMPEVMANYVDSVERLFVTV